MYQTSYRSWVLYKEDSAKIVHRGIVIITKEMQGWEEIPNRLSRDTDLTGALRFRNIVSQEELKDRIVLVSDHLEGIRDMDFRTTCCQAEVRHLITRLKLLLPLGDQFLEMNKMIYIKILQYFNSI